MSDQPHTCGHDTVAVRRTGDSMIIVCQKCGQETAYPLDDGDDPFPPSHSPIRVNWDMVCVASLGCLSLIAIITTAVCLGLIFLKH